MKPLSGASYMQVPSQENKKDQTKAFTETKKPDYSLSQDIKSWYYY